MSHGYDVLPTELTTAADVVADAGDATDDVAVELAAIVWRHLGTSGRYDDAVALAGLAVAAARRGADTAVLTVLPRREPSVALAECRGSCCGSRNGNGWSRPQ